MRLTTLCYLEQDGNYLMLHRIVKKHEDVYKRQEHGKAHGDLCDAGGIGPGGAG